MIKVRPVFDPAIPVEIRDALLAHTEGPLGERRRMARDGVRALALGAVCGLAPVALALGRMFGLAGRMVAVAGQVALVAAWFGGYALGGGLWPGIVATLAVQLTCTLGVFLVMDTWRVRRGIRQARGRYLLGDDFDPEAQALLARAQAAIAAVTGSQTAVAGLLDEVANDVVLSRQEWEIARALIRRGGGSPALVGRRVEALERYAEQVRDADAAFSQRLGAFATGPADEAVALAEIEDLTESARRVRDAIRAAPSGIDRPHGPRPEDQ